MWWLTHLGAVAVGLWIGIVVAAMLAVAHVADLERQLAAERRRARALPGAWGNGGRATERELREAEVWLRGE